MQSIGFNTRVVAFFFEQKEYEEEITALSRVAEKLSVRMNLRIAIVTDKDLINKMKRKYPQYFEELTKSAMLLKRYDGEVFKLNLSTADTVSYNWWINTKSKKPIDNLNHGSYQLGEVTNMPMVVIYVSFDSTKPKQFKKCTDAIAVLNNLAPQFDKLFMVFYTDDPVQLNQRKALGISWNTVPSMGLNTLHHTIYTYEKDLPFD